MEFGGGSCNILNTDGVVKELGPRDGIVRGKFMLYLGHGMLYIFHTSGRKLAVWVC